MAQSGTDSSLRGVVESLLANLGVLQSAFAASFCPMLKEVDDEASREALALQRIASALEQLNRQNQRENPLLSVRQMLGLASPKEQREMNREEREGEQVRLYQLVVIFAAVSALASVASVVVALLNA